MQYIDQWLFHPSLPVYFRILLKLIVLLFDLFFQISKTQCRLVSMPEAVHELNEHPWQDNCVVLRCRKVNWCKISQLNCFTISKQYFTFVYTTSWLFVNSIVLDLISSHSPPNKRDIEDSMVDGQRKLFV